MSMKHYLAARKEGLKQQHAAQARGQDPYLPWWGMKRSARNFIT